MSVFARFAPRLQEAIVSRLGWSSLRPVQEQAGEALLAGNNAVILAPTAGGKTEASMFPALSELVARPVEGVGVLYVAPIKALLNNQAARLGLYTEMVGLRRFVWHGDTADGERRRFVREPAELLMTTPESLEVMLVSARVDAAALFRDLRMVVVDEVHALAGTDRGAHLMSVIERLAALGRSGAQDHGQGGGGGGDVQRVGLSATVGNPDAILGWLRGSSARPGQVVRPAREPARRQLLVVHRPSLPELARDAARVGQGQKSLFFCQSRSMAEAVAGHMRRAGTDVLVHHSAVSHEERALAEERFHQGRDVCIVCTSTLELGIDVGDLDRVLQAEAPDTVSSFLQRMGRTGRRAGQAANTTFFCETAEGVLQAVALVELARQGWVEDVDVRARCWPVLVHQLLALALAHDGVTMEAAFAQLARVPDLAGIRRAEFERLLAWMLKSGSLRLASGRLVLGPRAERRFGRRNFMDLYAVFSSPQSYTVCTAADQVLGTLSQAFVDRLVEGVSSFLLAGRAWTVTEVRHRDRQVRVEPAPRGRQPTWGSFLPQFLGFRVCQEIRRILCSDEVYAYLDPGAAAVLAEKRAAFAGLLAPGGEGAGDIEVDEAEIRWWTFAGGRINVTLRYALEALGPWKGTCKVVADNHAVRVRGEGLDQGAFREAVARLRELELWDDERLWQTVLANLPSYRLSKFQALMPPWVEREMLADHLLDVEGAWRWVSGNLDGAVTASLGRVPEALRQAAARTPAAAPSTRSAVDAERAARVQARRPVRWIDSDRALGEVCRALAAEPVIGLDVETTLGSRALCLVQLAGSRFTAVIDALAISDLTGLAALLGDGGVVKVIHNASFERSVLGAHGVAIENIFDTLAVSRRLRGRDAPDGHGLAAVAARELGLALDKTAQTSDWTRRPLSAGQLAYAALDAEVLIDLYGAFQESPETDS